MKYAMLKICRLYQEINGSVMEGQINDNVIC